MKPGVNTSSSLQLYKPEGDTCTVLLASKYLPLPTEKCGICWEASYDVTEAVEACLGSKDNGRWPTGKGLV